MTPASLASVATSLLCLLLSLWLFITNSTANNLHKQAGEFSISDLEKQRRMQAQKVQSDVQNKKINEQKANGQLLQDISKQQSQVGQAGGKVLQAIAQAYVANNDQALRKILESRVTKEQLKQLDDAQKEQANAIKSGASAKTNSPGAVESPRSTPSSSPR